MTVPSTIDPGTYLTVDSPHEVARWRPLVHWLMAIPHFIVLHAFRALAGVVFVIYWFVLLFTGRLNSGLYGLMTMYERYNARVGGFFLGYTERYAPFDFNGGPADNSNYPPVVLELPPVPETASRKSLFNVLLAKASRANSFMGFTPWVGYPVCGIMTDLPAIRRLAPGQGAVVMRTGFFCLGPWQWISR